jgi:hypothetical protein
MGMALSGGGGYRMWEGGNGGIQRCRFLLESCTSILILTHLTTALARSIPFRFDPMT